MNEEAASTETDSLPPFWSDVPTEHDLCGFGPICNEVCDQIRGWARIRPKAFQSSLVLGINGPWGSGKTSLTLQIRKNLKANKPVFFTWIDISVWKYADRAAFLRSLVTAVLDEITERLQKLGMCNEHVRAWCQSSGIPLRLLPSDLKGGSGDLKLGDFIGRLEKSLYRATECAVVVGGTVNWVNTIADMVGGRGIGEGVPLLGTAMRLTRQAANAAEAKVKLESAIKDDELYRTLERNMTFEAIRSAEQFGQLFSLVSNVLCGLPPIKGLGEKCTGRLIFCIDDLDRCLPENAIEILETLKILLDDPLCCYLVPVDPAVVGAGLEMRYSGQMRLGAWFPDHRDYLDKIFHRRIYLDLLSIEQIKLMLSDLLATNLTESYKLEEGGRLQQLASALAVVCPNPRRIKIVLRDLRTTGNAAAHMGIDDLISAIYSCGFDLECGRKYPPLRNFPEVLEVLYEFFERPGTDTAKLSGLLKLRGVDESCVAQLAVDWRFRGLLNRVARFNEFKTLRRALEASREMNSHQMENHNATTFL
jgi:hypothetical protein